LRRNFFTPSEKTLKMFDNEILKIKKQTIPIAPKENQELAIGLLVKRKITLKNLNLHLATNNTDSDCLTS
jgi:hypothetical protein